MENVPDSKLPLDWAAHTEESGVALGKTLRDCYPTAKLAFVLAMASDKDKQAFARALLRGKYICYECSFDCSSFGSSSSFLTGFCCRGEA